MAAAQRILMIAVLAFGLMGAGDNTQRFEKLGHGLICTCGCNQVLLECNHVGCPASSGMRDELNAGLNGGASNDAVLEKFVAKYGPTVLAAPTTKGFNRVAWVMPFAVFIMGIMGVVVLSRTWKGRAAKARFASQAALRPDRAEALRAQIREETEI